MEITIIRHAKPEPVSGSPIFASELPHWIDLYNRAGVSKLSMPPLALVNGSDGGVIITSGLTRSKDSARQLNTKNTLISDELFDEADMPHKNWNGVKLKPKYWLVLFRVLWFFGYSGNSESYSEARQRALKAAEKLAELASSHQSVFLVGHGIFNRLIVKELKDLGWSGPRNPGSGYWSFGKYTK